MSLKNQQVTTIAGNSLGYPQFGTGIGTYIAYGTLTGVAIDSNNNIIVSDSTNNLIRKLSCNQFIIATSQSPTLSTAPTFSPTEIDFGSCSVSTVAGGAGSTLAGYTNAMGTFARFSFPAGLFYNSSLNLMLLTDSANNDIRAITINAAGEYVSSTIAGAASNIGGTYATQGYDTGIGTYASFYNPSDIAVYEYGFASGGGVVGGGVSFRMYIVDSSNSLIRGIKYFSNQYSVGSIAGGGSLYDGIGTNPPLSGFQDGTGNKAKFYFPASITSNDAGYAVITDSGNHAIRALTPSIAVTTLAGLGPTTSGCNDGNTQTGISPRFTSPKGITADSSLPYPNIFVADAQCSAIRMLQASSSMFSSPPPDITVTTIAGQSTSSLSGLNDGMGTYATFIKPVYITYFASQNVFFVGDQTAIRMIVPVGATFNVITIAGSSTSGYADGIGTFATFNVVGGLSAAIEPAYFGGAAVLYANDQINNVLRKLTCSVTGIISASPTMSPSISPSCKPSQQSTVAPSEVPSYPLSQMPSKIPSHSPSWDPSTSTRPTGRPSAPTRKPSTPSAPAVQPSTLQPSASAIPSFATSFPITIPQTANPTVTPSVTTTIPTFLPTSAPVQTSNPVTYSPSSSTSSGICYDQILAGVIPVPVIVSGSSNGLGTYASFQGPAGLVLDSGDNIYLADQGNNEIRALSVLSLSSAPSVNIYSVSTIGGDGNPGYVQ